MYQRICWGLKFHLRILEFFKLHRLIIINLVGPCEELTYVAPNSLIKEWQMCCLNLFIILKSSWLGLIPRIILFIHKGDNNLLMNMLSFLLDLNWTGIELKVHQKLLKILIQRLVLFINWLMLKNVVNWAINLKVGRPYLPSLYNQSNVQEHRRKYYIFGLINGITQISLLICSLWKQ